MTPDFVVILKFTDFRRATFPIWVSHFFATRNFGLNNVSGFKAEKDLALCGFLSWETEFVHKLNLTATVSGRFDFEWFQQVWNMDLDTAV